MEISFAKLRIQFPTALKTFLSAGAMLALGALSLYAATDTNFNVGGSGAGDLVYGVAVKSDGKIVIGGALLSVNGHSIQRVSTLDTNGAPDLSFTQAVNNIVRTVAVQPDGKVLIAGDFTIVAGVSSPYFARLSTNGTLDAVAPSTLNGQPLGMDVDPSGNIFLVGYFTLPRRGIIKMDSSLNIDSSFPEVGIAGTGEGANCIAINKDSGSTNYGKIYIGGSFTTPGQRVARFTTNGVADASFSGYVDYGTVKTIALQTVSGVEKVLIGGSFSAGAHTLTSRIARLEENGGQDNNFWYIDTPDNEVRSIVPHPDGTFFAAGPFTHAGMQGRICVAKYLNTGTNTGKVHPTWNTGWGPMLPGGFTGSVWCMALQGTNIIVGGYFSSWNGNSHYMYERLLP
jgi:hypothetical protein